MGYTSALLQLSFPRLKRASLDAFCLDVEPWMQIDWLEQCPNLTKLHWKFIFYDFPATKFMTALKRNTWPCLEELSLDKLDERDDDLARTLVLLPPFCRFRLRSAKFDPATLSTLRERLFGTIRDLDMTGVVDLTSWMAVSVLQECVHLEEFKTVTINAEDIDNDSRPWACRGLKRLETIFICRSIVSNERALESLSRLTTLEYLDIGHEKQIASVVCNLVSEGAQSLTLVLEHGLSRLVPLTKLRVVGLMGTEQKMAEEDLRWMHESWPALEEVRGSTMRAATNTSG
ncbi:hypothetical protein BGX30_011845 [Mortierella sp. GBA39]|nr:hypothetical protein BGX30_011845 [Mortierella sp. GBA39]